MTLIADYYAEPAIRRRMLEFLGGAEPDEASAVFITADNVSRPQYLPRVPSELPHALSDGAEVGRSLWDRQALLVHLDIEYVNFDDPAAVYLDPQRAFELQTPVTRALERLLARAGVDALHLLTGRGHHYVWAIDQSCASFAALYELATLPPEVEAVYAAPQPPHGELVCPRLGRAFAGLALVLEHLGHRICRLAASQCAVPLQLTAVEARRPRAEDGASGAREIISIDLSEYGDLLHLRNTRLPFSAYLKPQRQRARLGSAGAPLFTVPCEAGDGQLPRSIAAMRDPTRALALGRRASTIIPDASATTMQLIDDYRRSRLARFHRYFYREAHDPPAAWPDTYDRLPRHELPPCARALLERPNDLLLKPAGLQHLTRVLTAKGWHPRHIAGLVRSKYERDHGWGRYWLRYSAVSRADFYVRLFSGLFADGTDGLVDLNCRSHQERGYCPARHCDSNLVDLRETLRQRLRGAHDHAPRGK